jgi:glycerophosphoryl diester phosphodiesterase
MPAAIDTVRAGGHRGLHPHHSSITAQTAAVANAAGVSLAAWTVDDGGRARELAELGVAFLITNDVRVVRAALTPPASRD